MANKKDLKAFVRYDGTGRVIPGSLILQRNKPKVGQWSQIGAYECCDPGCLPPVEGVDFTINDLNVTDAGMTVNITSSVNMQIDIFNCDTNASVGDPQTVPAGAVEFIVYFPAELVYQGCTFTVRKICNPALLSPWTPIFGG